MSRRGAVVLVAAVLAALSLAALALAVPRLRALLPGGDPTPAPGATGPAAAGPTPSPSPATTVLMRSPPRNARVTRDSRAGSYVRHDGGTDPAIEACGNGRREQNEPTVAVDPGRPEVVVAGANEYCTAMTTGDSWVGYYRSTDGGRTWAGGLVPGYPIDDSVAGRASPAHRSCGGASDPTMSFDRQGRLFYGFICFDRGGHGEAGVLRSSTFVATFDRHGSRYVRTALVARGTPDRNQDKINLVVDQTDGPHAGNVYAAWVSLAPPTEEGVPQDPMLFARSTDHGRTFSEPIPVSTLVHARFPDMAVGADGTLYVTFRAGNTFWLARSTDGGRSFRTPVQIATPMVPFDSHQFGGGGGFECGIRSYRCPTGLVFARFESQAAVAADGRGVHVVWNERVGRGQSKVLVRTSADGVSWSAPRRIDEVPRGHQFLPDVAASGGVLTVAFHDSRNDPAYSPQRPPGNTAKGRSSGAAVDVFVALSTDGARTWSERRVTTRRSNFGFLTSGPVPFWGDYLYVSAVRDVVQVAWTDSRDVVPKRKGSFAVHRPCPSRPVADDPCLSEGGSDQNIYTARIRVAPAEGG